MLRIAFVRCHHSEHSQRAWHFSNTATPHDCLICSSFLLSCHSVKFNHHQRKDSDPHLFNYHHWGNVTLLQGGVVSHSAGYRSLGKTHVSDKHDPIRLLTWGKVILTGVTQTCCSYWSRVSLQNLNIISSLIAAKKKKIRYNLLKRKIQSSGHVWCFNKPNMISYWGIKTSMREDFQFWTTIKENSL